MTLYGCPACGARHPSAAALWAHRRTCAPRPAWIARATDPAATRHPRGGAISGGIVR